MLPNYLVLHVLMYFDVCIVHLVQFIIQTNKYIYKVKRCRYRPGVAQRVGRGIVILSHDRGTIRRLGGPQGWSGRAENLGIRSRTVQPIVSRYTD